MTTATVRQDEGLRAIAWDDKPAEFMTAFGQALKKDFGISLEITSDAAEFYRRFKAEGPWDFVVLDLVEIKDDGEVDPLAGMYLAEQCRKAVPKIPIFMVTSATSTVLRQARTVVHPTYFMAKELGVNWVALDVNDILTSLYNLGSQSPSRDREHIAPTTVVFSALHEELNYLYQEPGWEWSDLKQDRIGATYRSCEINGRRVIAASAPKMGLTHTAVTASSLFHEWRPDLAFMIGVCAGRKKSDVSLGDVIIPELAYHFQYGSYVDGELHGQIVAENVNERLLAVARDFFARDDNMNQIRSDFPQAGHKPRETLRGHVGPMACSDLVVMDKTKFEEAAKADRKVIGLEMESYAFLLAARLSGVGRALVVKSVIDFADEKKDDDFREYAKFTSTKTMLALLEKLSP